MEDQDKKTVNTAPAENGANVQADVDEIMKKYDRESNVRIWEGVPKYVVSGLLIAFSLFLMWMNLVSTWSETKRRPLFLGLVILLVFIVFPMRKGAVQRVNRIPWYDIIWPSLGPAPTFISSSMSRI